jgi:hypothetical protein
VRHSLNGRQQADVGSGTVKLAEHKGIPGVNPLALFGDFLEINIVRVLGYVLSELAEGWSGP